MREAELAEEMRTTSIEGGRANRAVAHALGRARREMSAVDGEAQHAALQAAVEQLAPGMEKLAEEQHAGNDPTAAKLSPRTRRRKATQLASKKVVAALYSAALGELGEELAHTRAAVVMSSLGEGELERLRAAIRDKDATIHRLSLDLLQAWPCTCRGMPCAMHTPPCTTTHHAPCNTRHACTPTPRPYSRRP